MPRVEEDLLGQRDRTDDSSLAAADPDRDPLLARTPGNTPTPTTPYVQAYITQISPQIDGRVVKLLVDDFEHREGGPSSSSSSIRATSRSSSSKFPSAARPGRRTTRPNHRRPRPAASPRPIRLKPMSASPKPTSGQAQSDFTRYRSVDPQAVSRQQVDTANASNKSAQAKVDAQPPGRHRRPSQRRSPKGA